jgi:hypothetical protein
MANEPDLNRHQKVEVAEHLDRASRNVLEFLMEKFPSSPSKIIDVGITNYIKEMDNHFEILKNAKVQFL